MRREDKHDFPRELLEAVAQAAELMRPVVHPPHKPTDDIGYCWRCGLRRTRAEARQVERDEACVHACVVCGDTLDEAPF